MRLTALVALLSIRLCAQDLESLRQAAVLHPNDVQPHLALGAAFLKAWVPGSANHAPANSAEIEFRRVLGLDANNTTALSSLAALSANYGDRSWAAGSRPEAG